MENFKVNLDRPEPDIKKIQAKKDFNKFQSSYFPKSTLYHSKWFWGVTGIASIAIVVSVSLTSFSKNQPDLLTGSRLESIPISSVENKLGNTSADVIDSNVDVIKMSEKFEVAGSLAIEKDEQEPVKDEEVIQNEVEEMTVEKEYVPIRSELFTLDFVASDFPNLNVGSNLFYIHPDENKSSQDLFSNEWDGIELIRKGKDVYISLTERDIKVSYKVVQFNN